ncbi:MAG: peptidase C11, partial [Lachnospiraceae bacterium]|nr:peptidase C11 [Lachnospiraceae bacterium]
VDLVHLAQNVSGKEANELKNAVMSAVKYNRFSSNMTNANGISIYFPYKKSGKVDSAVKEYEQIGMDSEYTKAIKEFANLNYSGQAHAVSTSVDGAAVGSPLASLLGGLISGNGLSNLTTSIAPSGWTQTAQTESYVESHSLDASKLKWTKDSDGKYKLILSEEQWKLVQDLDLNVFVDDGEGFIDLGLDNVFEFDSKKNLIGEFDDTWLSINGQIVAYYHLDTMEEGNHYSITGYVPVEINGVRSELILVFDDARPYGYIAGARDVYQSGETDVEAKSLTEIQAGDRFDFLCDYYSYDGTYLDSYHLGKTMIYDGNAVIGNLRIENEKTSAAFRITDIYQQTYWTPVIP